MLTHLHMIVYTWWCWHICKAEEVGVEKGLKELVMGWPNASDMWTECVRYLTQVVVIPTWLDASNIDTGRVWYSGQTWSAEACVRTQVRGGDRMQAGHCSCVQSEEAKRTVVCTWRRGASGRLYRTRPVTPGWLLELSRVDLMLPSEHLIVFLQHVRSCLSERVERAVRRQWLFDLKGTRGKLAVTGRSHQTHPVCTSCMFGQFVFLRSEGVMTVFVRGVINRALGWTCAT
jgi:hypothetical protein